MLNRILLSPKSTFHYINFDFQADNRNPDLTKPNSSDSVFSSIYGKFRAQAPRLSELIRLLENHATSSDEVPVAICREYESALVDCRAVYLECRRQLVRLRLMFKGRLVSHSFIGKNKYLQNS